MTGNGKGGFKAQMPYESGLFISGEVRKVRKITLKNGVEALVFARNNDKLKIMKWR